MEPNRPADQLLRRQHGVIGREQALDTGLTSKQIRSRLETHEWVRLSTGVYVTASSAPTWERQLMAAVLSHPRSLVAGRSAGALLGFERMKRGRPEILVPFSGNARSHLARVIRARHFEDLETTSVNGFLSTTPAETILTLSLREHPALLERVIDNELTKGRLAIPDFNPILDRLAFARQPGLRSLRRIVGERAETSYQPPTSELERLLYAVLDHPSVPRYSRQLPIEFQSVTATVDAYVERWRTIVEGDGRRWHTREADFVRDRQRDNEALAAGFVVVRFTWKMLRYEPESCLNTLVMVGRQRQMT